MTPDNLVPRAHVSFGQRQNTDIKPRKDTWGLGTRTAGYLVTEQIQFGLSFYAEVLQWLADLVCDVYGLTY